jgi:hypothetical protein
LGGTNFSCVENAGQASSLDTVLAQVKPYEKMEVMKITKNKAEKGVIFAL